MRGGLLLTLADGDRITSLFRFMKRDGGSFLQEASPIRMLLPISNYGCECGLRIEADRKIVGMVDIVCVHIIVALSLERVTVHRDDGLILPTSYASALRLILGATHLIALCATLVEQSSSARLQASLQTRSASII